MRLALIIAVGSSLCLGLRAVADSAPPPIELPRAGASEPAAKPAVESRRMLESFEAPEGSPLSALGWVGGQVVDGKPDHFLVKEGGRTFLRSSYRPNSEAKYVYKEIEWDSQEYPFLRWRWRAHKFPEGARVLDSKVSDAAAQVYVLWKVGRRNYVIKYFWTTAESPGDVLRQGSIFFGKLYGLVLRAGGKRNEWHTETRNVHQDFHTAFEEYPRGKVRGIAVLSDADETKGESEADFDDFEILRPEALEAEKKPVVTETVKSPPAKTEPVKAQPAKAAPARRKKP